MKREPAPEWVIELPALPDEAERAADRPALCRADHWRRGDPLRSLGSAAAARAAGGHALGSRLLMVVGLIMMVGQIMLFEVFPRVWSLLICTVLLISLERTLRMLIAHWKFSRNRRRAFQAHLRS
jgi:hypothetical protein